jgi:hypothetical protein
MEVVAVEWFDVTKTINDDSFDEKQDVDNRLSKMKTTGWLFQQTEKVILLVQEFDDETPRDWIVIPKVLITNIETIKQ